MKAVTKKLQSGGVQEGPGFTHQSWDRLQPHCHPELDNQKKMDGLLFLATWSFLWMPCVCVCGGGLVYICWFSLSLRLCVLFKKQSINII